MSSTQGEALASFADRARTGVTILAGLLAIGGALASETGTASAAQPRARHELRSISSLRGYGKVVSPALTETLDGATLQLTEQNKDDSSSASEICTVTKIEEDGQDYGLTAAHCLDDLTGHDGSITGGSGTFSKVSDKIPALDFYNPLTSPYNFWLVDPDAPASAVWDPIALIGGITVSMQAQDYALIKVDTADIPPPPRNEDLPVSQRNYNNVPAIPYNDTLKNRPVPGEQVALHASIPSNFDAPVVSGTGIYLGRISYGVYQPFDARTYTPTFADMVAVRAPEVEDDPCYYGASGGGAMTATGQLLGPLSNRLTIGYGPRHTIYLPDSPRKAGVQQEWRGIEKQLDVRIPEGTSTGQYNVLCTYGVPFASTVPSLANAFGKYYNYKTQNSAT